MFLACFEASGLKKNDFLKNPDASKQAKNTYLATNGARIRIQYIFLTHLDRVWALQLHGMTHSARILHFPRFLALFSTGCLAIFLRYSHSLYKAHTADPPVSSFPIGMSHTIIMEHPCPPLIRDGLRFICGKPIANPYSRRGQRGLGGGTL